MFKFCPFYGGQRVSSPSRTQRDDSINLGDRLPDLRIISNDQETFWVHLEVMSKECKYFETLQEREVTFEEYDAGLLQVLINYCYKRECSIDKNNLMAVIEAAHKLQIGQLSKQSCIEAGKLVDNENYLRLFRLGISLEKPELMKTASDYFVHNLKTAVYADDFEKLDYNVLYKLFKHSAPNIPYLLKFKSLETSHIQKAVNSWLKSNPETSLRNLKRLWFSICPNKNLANKLYQSANEEIKAPVGR